MLLKLNSIEEIGRFSQLKHKAEQFSRLTLIYARNGYGKSTLSAILRSASDQQSSYISARRRLDAVKESRVQSSWASNTSISFGSNKWNASPGKIHIFDQEYVFQNLHVGESVTRDNKRRLLPVVLGQRGVRLSKIIQDLDKDQRSQDEILNKYGAIIQAKCPVIPKTKLADYCEREVPDGVDANIKKAAKAVELAKQVVAVRQKSNPKEIPLKSVDILRGFLARTIDNISETAAKRVKDHLTKHNLGERAEGWLRYGTEHRHGEECPFCDQSLDGIEIVDAYSGYFSDAFVQFTDEIELEITELSQIIGDGFLLSTCTQNDVDFEFWQTVCELPLLPELTEEDRNSITKGIRHLGDIFKNKISHPTATLDFGEHETCILAATELLTDYNSKIRSCISEIELARAYTATANLDESVTVLSRWEALRAKQFEPVSLAASAYSKAVKRKKEITAEKKEAQENLKTYAKEAMNDRESDVNQLLSDFGSNFQIVDAKANFVGREPNTEFAISIGTKTVKAGNQSETEPSFKTLLSTSDKVTLALAFFLSQVRSDPTLSSTCVVFDDPFNSQDMNREFVTTSEIRAISELAGQTIVLSHDPRFLKTIKKDSQSVPTNEFQILCTDEGEGTICKWSSSEELKELYVGQSERIREFALHGKLLKGTTCESILKDIRPFLEDYLRARYPGRFQNSDFLSKMATDIKNAGPADLLFPSADSLLALNEYSRPNMHGGGNIPNPDSLRVQCKKIVEILGSY